MGSKKKLPPDLGAAATPLEEPSQPNPKPSLPCPYIETHSVRASVIRNKIKNLAKNL
jgi:hypothetical protein